MPRQTAEEKGVGYAKLNSQLVHGRRAKPCELRIIFCFTLDDFLTVGIDSDAASDLFAVLANREHHLPTLIASQSGPGYWVEALPDRVAADSIVNRLANHSRTINLGTVDMRKLRDDQARAEKHHWE